MAASTQAPRTLYRPLLLSAKAGGDDEVGASDMGRAGVHLITFSRPQMGPTYSPKVYVSMSRSMTAVKLNSSSPNAGASFAFDFRIFCGDEVESPERDRRNMFIYAFITLLPRKIRRLLCPSNPLFQLA